MQANYVQRLRLTFSKEGAARYIGHLDLARTFERSLNRAGIPIAYTQGFNRRPRMAFAAPLPLGFLSKGELVDLWLGQQLEPGPAREQMMAKMAPGIDILQVEEVPLRSPSLQSITAKAIYTVTPLDPVDSAALEGQINRLLGSSHLPRQRKKGKGKVKAYDLRPLIVDLALQSPESSQISIRMELLLKTGKSGRPDEVLQELALDPLAARIWREKILLNPN